MCLRGIVQHQIALFFAACPDHAEQVACVWVNNSHCRLRRHAARILREAGLIRVNLLHNALHLRIHQRVNAETAGIDHIAGDLARDTVLLHQIVTHITNDRIDIPGIEARLCVRGCRFIIGAFPEGQRFGKCLFHLRLGDLPLLLHLIQDVVTAFEVVFRILYRVVFGRVLGDGGKRCAFRQRQLGEFLTEVGIRRRADTDAILRQRNDVEIEFEDLFLALDLLQIQRGQDLLHFTLNGRLVVAGQVLDQLLCDGRTTVG